MIVSKRPRDINLGAELPLSGAQAFLQDPGSVISLLGELGRCELGLTRTGTLWGGTACHTARIRNWCKSWGSPGVEAVGVVHRGRNCPSVHRPCILRQRGLHGTVAKAGFTVASHTIACLAANCAALRKPEACLSTSTISSAWFTVLRIRGTAIAPRGALGPPAVQELGQSAVHGVSWRGLGHRTMSDNKRDERKKCDDQEKQ